MNIFILDENPQLSAEYHCDKHCVKMILETAQLLCGAFEKGDAPYKRTHYNHPCAKWSRESQSNYLWLVDFGKELATEYTKRYGKTHKSLAVISWCGDNFKSLNLPKNPMTPFALAMPDKYRHLDPVKSYRDYYLGEKSEIAEWKHSKKPTWFKLKK